MAIRAHITLETTDDDLIESLKQCRINDEPCKEISIGNRECIGKVLSAESNVDGDTLVSWIFELKVEA